MVKNRKKYQFRNKGESNRDIRMGKTKKKN